MNAFGIYNVQGHERFWKKECFPHLSTSIRATAAICAEWRPSLLTFVFLPLCMLHIVSWRPVYLTPKTTLQVISAQTTFELMLGHSCSDSGPAKVPYLRHLPIDARPFSQGVFKNILDFCCGTEGKTYQVPAALSARKSTAEFWVWSAKTLQPICFRI